MMSKFEQNYAISVGAVLADDLRMSKMTQKELAEKIDVSKSIINEIIKGKRKMSLDVAIALESVLGAPAKYWLNIQSDYELAMRKNETYLVDADVIIQTGKYNALDIAHWFINRTKQDVAITGEYISHLKLQKELFLAQERSLKENNMAIFIEPITHWEYGPVVDVVYHEYKANGANAIVDAPVPKLDEETIKLLESVYKFYVSFSASGLVTITHKKAAWKDTKEGEEITLEQIKNN